MATLRNLSQTKIALMILINQSDDEIDENPAALIENTTPVSNVGARAHDEDNSSVNQHGENQPEDNAEAETGRGFYPRKRLRKPLDWDKNKRIKASVCGHQFVNTRCKVFQQKRLENHTSAHQISLRNLRAISLRTFYRVLSFR
ncbi:hypothetical protein PoB_006373600 [Plakobranchus ocellatus]|uniref:C2H2-type domain-containing protein n=1 Tax=Plakobranchus ocellatus TaxID=259542 RepID=A0AAV4CZS4_9GAST|nr:hypothetical protein PoB_006373600 [Plakobranchus ocellatus]